MAHQEHPVFFDHSGKRWSSLIKFMSAIAFILSIAGALFSFSVVALPLSPFSLSFGKDVHSYVPKIETRTEAESKYAARKARQQLKRQIAIENSHKQSKRHQRGAGKPYSTVVGFYVNWEATSFQSFKNNVDSLTHVMPEWLYLKSDGKSFGTRMQTTGNDAELIKIAAKHNVQIVPMLENMDQNAPFLWDRLEKLLTNKDSQEQLAEDLRDYLIDKHFAGINIDFEPPYDKMSKTQLTKAQKLLHDNLPDFIKLLKCVFKPAHLIVTQDLPAEDNHYDYGKLGEANDFVVIMLYDKHATWSDPGAIAPQDWLEDRADEIFQQMDSSKVILGVANYCYDWPFKVDEKGNMHKVGNSNSVNKLMLGPALNLADEAGTDIKMDDDEYNPYFTYSNNKGEDHIVYILDAITAYNETIALRGYEPRGVALWYLGSEDPTIWRFFNPRCLGKPINTSDLSKVVYKWEVDDSVQGGGELEQVAARPTPGYRKLTVNKDGIITSEKYTRYPSPFLLQRNKILDKTIALTFDDGPSPIYTPKILRVLKKYNVPGTFFVIGSNAEKYEGIVKECWDSGNEIGNHTFTHPHITEVSPTRAKLEVNATQRMIESIIGHSSRLFRPPFGEGADVDASTTIQGASVIMNMQQLGYVTVGFNIDSKDYERKGINTIENNVYRDCDKGNVVLFHDGGGNRDQTIEALPYIIKHFKKLEYRFVTVSELLGKNAKANMFPVVTHNQVTMAGVDKLMFETGFNLTRFLQIIFLVSIILGILRILIVTPMALIQSRRAKSEIADTSYAPPVTVIIPAYNEENVISKTVETVLNSNYNDLEIIVVDDGSTDDTAGVIKRNFSSDSRVRLICKKNGGKASALNLGVKESKNEILVCLDGDTVFAKDTISKLVRQFADPKVGAVAGNVKVGNRINLLTIWQSVEYISSQNFDRRAYSLFNAIPVVPGAAGAWRKSAIIKAGGYQSNTLAEDTDLTFNLMMLGYHTRTENEALAYTEAPDTLKSLIKQRFRWSFGILQSLWKHRRALCKSKYGAYSWFVMPSMWLYSVIFQLFSPLVDIAALIAIFNCDFSSVLMYYGALFVIDFASALIAFRLDNENVTQLSWLFLQRIFYRQFLYYVNIKSILAALRGHSVGWGKLQRKGTNELPKVEA